MKIYALLVGINNYPRKPLNQCVNDALKFEAYLNSLKSGTVEVETLPLHDDKATKKSITTGISEFLGQAGNDDVALFYYSGHGAHEDTAGRFKDEHDGLLECIVSHYDKDQDAGFLLADKEIRYLFSNLPNNPHLVSVFDCCHSGDMVRALAEGEEHDQIKRLSGFFDARNYDEFIFSKDITVADLATKTLAENIPFKNHVHIAACSSSQSSWESKNGGVFTRYLLDLLAATHNKINYQEITRWAKISLKDITKKTQSPTISIQGDGDVSALSSWLKLNENSTVRKTPSIIFNEGKGWYLTMGSLMGIKKGTEVTVDPEGKNFKVKVKEVDIAESLVENPLVQGRELEENKYPVKLNPTTIFSRLALYINDLDNEPEEKKKIQQIVEEYDNVELSDAGGADFFINIFNEFVYVSLPQEEFQPLARQIDILDDEENLERKLRDQLKYLVKWNHFNTLENPDENFDSPPIKVELKIHEKDKWHDVTNAEFTMDPKDKRFDKKDENGKVVDRFWMQAFQVRVTNISQETLHVGVLGLSSDKGISSNPWQEQVVDLNKGESKLFYDHTRSQHTSVFLDPYKEVYNWKQEWFHYKFIVNNFEDFTPAIRDYLQPELEHPLVIDKLSKEISVARGELGFDAWAEVVKRWGTLKTTVRMNNPVCNVISGDLQGLWEEYKNSEKLGPFINMLYLYNKLNGFIAESESFPNRTGEDENQKSIGGIKKNLGNFLDNLRRKRKFKKARRRMKDKPVVIAEGDSWFLYPFLVKDIIDYVMEEFPVRSIAAAGDELQNYKKDGQLLKEVAEIRPKYVLISGGGNDIIGPEIQHIIADNIPPGREPAAYLNDKFPQNMAKLEELYLFFIEELKKHESVQQVFLHGYDYIRSDHQDKIVSKGWVNKYLNLKGVNAVNDRDRVIRYMIDTFNDVLIKISKDDPFVTYLNLREKVLKGQWFDEIHPDNVGFKSLGNIYIDAINTLQQEAS